VAKSKHGKPLWEGGFAGENACFRHSLHRGGRMEHSIVNRRWRDDFSSTDLNVELKAIAMCAGRARRFPLKDAKKVEHGNPL